MTHRVAITIAAVAASWSAARLAEPASGQEAAAVAVAEEAVIDVDAAEAAEDAVGFVLDIVAPPPAIAVPIVDPADAAGDEPPPEQVDPFLQMFKPILQTELSFARRACRLKPEQLAAAVEASKTWMLDYARDYAKKNGQPQNGVMFAVGWQQQQQQESPRDAIREGVAAAVKKITDPEQIAKYDAELAKRLEFQHEAIVDNLIAKIDGRLCLTPKQRGLLRSSLMSKWEDKWAPELDNLVHMGDYLPQIPEKLVTPFLNDDQLEMWKGIQKVSFGRHFQGDQGWINGGQAIADVDVGELKAEAKQSAERKAADAPADAKEKTVSEEASEK